MLNLNDLKIGDSVRFVNGQVAKVVETKRFGEKTLHLFFDEEVASVADEPQPVYSSEWFYKLETGECRGCNNHIIEIVKKGELKC